MVAAIVGVGSAVAGLYGASKQASAANNAANAQQNAANAATAEQQREFDINQQNQAPWLKTGGAAENALGSLYGLNGSGTAGQVNYGQFLNSPDYQWELQQGTKNLDASAAARGNLYSGGYGNTLTNYAQGMASQQLNNYANRLAQIAGSGQSSAFNLGAAGQNMANQIGANDLYAGNAAANGYINNANVWANYANNLSSFGNQFATAYGSRPQAQTASQFNSGFTGNGLNLPNDSGGSYNYLAGLGG